MNTNNIPKSDRKKQCRVCRQRTIGCISLSCKLDGIPNLTIENCILICSGVKCEVSDTEIPFNICEFCADELKITYIFLEKIRESETFFQEHTARKAIAPEIEKIEFLEGYEQVVANSQEGWDEIPIEEPLITDQSSVTGDEDVKFPINVDEIKNEPYVYKGITIKKPVKEKVSIKTETLEPETKRPRRSTVSRKTYEESDESSPEFSDVIEQDLSVDDEDFVLSGNESEPPQSEDGEIEVPPEDHKPARKRSRPKNDEASKKKKEKTEIPFIRQKQIDVDLEGDFAIEIDGKIMQKCNKCDKMFPKLGSLRSHIKFVHLKIREWLCSMCPKMFVSKLRLEEHFRSHTGVRPYKCEFCPMAFATPTRKKLHMIIHTGENPNVCKYCGKRFASYATLQGHIFIHTKQGVECTVCKKMFARAVDVKKHMAVHTQEKSFICKICGKGYLYATSLKSHMKNHTFENVSCKICGDSVSSLDEWNYHQQLHAKEIFECETCGVTFIEQHELYAHMRTAHVDIENLQKAKSEREMDKVPPLAISKTEEQITIPEATVTTEENEISVNNELLQSVAETNLFNS